MLSCRSAQLNCTPLLEQLPLHTTRNVGRHRDRLLRTVSSWRARRVVQQWFKDAAPSLSLLWSDNGSAALAFDLAIGSASNGLVFPLGPLVCIPSHACRSFWGVLRLRVVTGCLGVGAHGLARSQGAMGGAAMGTTTVTRRRKASHGQHLPHRRDIPYRPYRCAEISVTEE